MAKVLITDTYLSNIAGAIRNKLGVQTTYTPPQMAGAIASIPTGSEPVLQSKTATQNGTVLPDAGYDGLSSVIVNVSGGGGMDGVYKGTTPPSSDIGVNGDIYLRVFPIPTSITFVEYLRGTGTQYIDTGLIGSNHTQVDIKAYRDATVGILMGARKARNNSAFCITNTNTRSIVRYDRGSTEQDVTNANVTRLFEMSAEFAEGVSEFTTPSSMLLFAASSDSIVVGISVVDIYRARFYESGALVADFLPAIDGSSIPCMYDVVSGSFFYNQGTGSFEYGEVITPTYTPPTTYIKTQGVWVPVRGAYGLT